MTPDPPWHPLLFSAPMVRALLSGVKTQTRRLVTDSTSRGNVKASGLDLASAWVDAGPSPVGNPGPYLKARLALRGVNLICGRDPDDDVVERLYPKWWAKDRLWVKETFRQGDGSMAVHYRADLDEVSGGPWRPSIFMPRWASRIALEIEQVRAQRLQEITDEDAIAEGILELVPRDNRGEGLTPGALAMAAAVVVADMDRPTRRAFLTSALAASLGFVGHVAGGSAGERSATRRLGLVGGLPLQRGPTPRELYWILWDSINADRAPWSTNPWVWPLTIRRIVE